MIVKRITRITGLWIVCVLLMSLNTDAQNLSEDLQLLAKNLEKAGFLTIKASVEVIGDNGQIQQKQLINLQKRENEFYLNLGESEVLFSKEAVVSVSHEMKTVMLTSRSKKTEQVVQMPDWNMGLDSLIPTKPKYKYYHVGNIHKYVLTLASTSDIAQIELELSQDKKRLLKVVYTYRVESDFQYRKVQITYLSFNTDAIASSAFATSRVVRKQKDRWVLQSPYLKYELEVLN